MKTSIWTAFFVEKSPEDAILEIAKSGYKYAELSDEHGAMLLERGDPKTVGEAFGKFAREAGVEVLQGHLFLTVALAKDGAVGVLKKWLDLFLAIGIKNAVLHLDASFPPNTDLEEIYAENKSALSKLVAHLEGTDMVICLENMRPGVPSRREELVPYDIHFASAEFLRYIKDIGGEHLGICLDTGHLLLSRAETPREFILNAGCYLKALHITDNEGERDQHLMPFCVGNLDVAAVIGALKEIGYEGLFNFEIPGERMRPLAIRNAKLKFLAECVSYMESTI